MNKKFFILFLSLFIFSNISFAETKITKEEYKESIIKLQTFGNYETAKNLADNYIKEYPEDGEAYLSKGILELSNPEKAIYYLTKSIKSGNLDTESSAVAKFARGKSYLTLDKYESSYEDFESITQEEFNLLSLDEQYHYYVCRCELELFYNQNYYKLIYYANKALDMNKSPELYFLRGIAFLRTGQEIKAKEDFAIQKYMCARNNNYTDIGCAFIPILNWRGDI